MSMMRFIMGALTLLTLSDLATGPAHALDAPNGRVVLTVAGSIGETNTPNSTADFDLEMLDRLGAHIVETDTPWTNGVITFEGALFRELLGALDANGDTIIAKALNDYRVEIPMAEVLEYDVILATKIDGKPISVRERGPIWVIYPWNDNIELRKEITYTRSIWQLRHLEIR